MHYFPIEHNHELREHDFLAETSQDIFAMDQGRVAQCHKSCLHDYRHAHPYGRQPHQHGDGKGKDHAAQQE